MKKGLFLSAIAAVALASCSNEQVVDQPKGDNLIGFSPLTTRGTVVTNAQGLQATTFKAIGLNPAGNAYLTADVNYSSGEWTYSPKATWPNEALDFYAVNPATDANRSDLNISNTGKSFKYVVPTAVADQKDVMYAAQLAQTKANGTVALMFKHALAQVAFKVQTTNAKYTAEINSIEVCNLLNTGTFTFPSVATAAGDQSVGSWRNEATVSNYAVKTVNNSPVSVTGTTSVDVTAADGVLLQLPQNPTKWETTKSTPVPVAIADAKKHCYLKIELKLKDTSSNTYLVGDANTFTTVYMPFGYNWVMGKKYIYNLKFGDGAGFDNEGNPILKFIEFSASVENWIEENVVDIDM